MATRSSTVGEGSDAMQQGIRVIGLLASAFFVVVGKIYRTLASLLTIAPDDTLSVSPQTFGIWLVAFARVFPHVMAD